MTKLSKYYRQDSQNRLFPYQSELSFKDMVELYSCLDLPASQVNWGIFWKDFKKLAPKYNGPEMQLFRGTSLETLGRFGSQPYIWTPSRELAVWFANHCCSPRYRLFGAVDRTPALLSYKASPSEIIYDHTNGRGESETFIEINDGTMVSVLPLETSELWKPKAKRIKNLIEGLENAKI